MLRGCDCDTCVAKKYGKGFVIWSFHCVTKIEGEKILQKNWGVENQNYIRSFLNLLYR